MRPPIRPEKTIFPILAAISIGHMLNDTVQSLIPAIYPILKSSFHLDFSQVGLITLTYQLTASLLQPFVGLYTDRKPHPFSLPVGMSITLAGLLSLAFAHTYAMLIFSSSLVGMGSSIFHPESSRVARMASGGKHGLAQSLFQVGGNAGTSLGPLLAAFIVLPHGQRSIAWVSVATLAGIFLLTTVSFWYKKHPARKRVTKASAEGTHLPRRTIWTALVILVALIFSKYFYLASISSYYTFYLMSKFHLSVKDSQLYLFLFLGSAAAGTLIGGPVGDRIGRKPVIWASILGVLPFTLALPYSNLFWTAMLTIFIGLVLSSAFTAILVYAQELMPGNVGLVSGIFFGFAFGMGGIGAAVLGKVADMTSIGFVYHICSFLPAIGLMAAFLPRERQSV
jgi:FSR family fosmidomycin resistance protein-like MFS transporter